MWVAGTGWALAVLVQYRIATTEQMHWVIAPGVRIEQTRRRLTRLREEGLVDRITLPQAGRRRVWFPTSYGVRLACEWPELRGRRPSRAASDPTAVRLKVSHALTVTETALAFLQDARRRGDVCRPLDWMTEVHHPIGSGHDRTSATLRAGPVRADLPRRPGRSLRRMPAQDPPVRLRRQSPVPVVHGVGEGGLGIDRALRQHTPIGDRPPADGRPGHVSSTRSKVVSLGFPAGRSAGAGASGPKVYRGTVRLFPSSLNAGVRLRKARMVGDGSGVGGAAGGAGWWGRRGGGPASVGGAGCAGAPPVPPGWWRAGPSGQCRRGGTGASCGRSG
ncbi:hypothetical protein M2158_004560 [Streptomyces sp. SAI-144]|nr:hypothetical protein [Streptomyces sp. SAI-144]